MADLFNGGTAWVCGRCGGATSEETALLDHQEWCLGDAEANTRLLADVAGHDGSLDQEVLVATARQRRLVEGEAHRPRLPD